MYKNVLYREGVTKAQNKSKKINIFCPNSGLTNLPRPLESSLLLLLESPPRPPLLLLLLLERVRLLKNYIFIGIQQKISMMISTNN